MKKPVLLGVILVLLLILVASVAVASAARAATQSPPTLEGVRWVLVSYTDSQGKVATALPEAAATAEFAAARVTGSAGCNRYSAAFTVDGNKLTVQQAASTMMACSTAVMAQETAFLANLQAAATHKIDGEQLSIADASGAVVLTFRAEKAASLVGPTWLMTAFNNGRGGFQSALADVKVTAIFDAEGKLTGNAGCNTYNAPYTVDGASIKIGPPATTRMMCAQNIMTQETAYLNALTKAATFKIEGNKLTMRDATGAAMAGYTQTAAPAQAAAPAAPAAATAVPATGGAATAPAAAGVQGDKSYVTLLPAADASVRTIVLNLKADGAAELTQDYGKEAPIVETGTWVAGDGLVTVTLTGKGDEKYPTPVVMKFQRDGTYLTLVDYDKAIWGENGLKLNQAGEVARKLRSSMVTFDVAAGFPLDPTFVSAFAGGQVDARLLGGECAGFISLSPVATVKWSGQAERVRVFFYSDGDPTIVVLTPRGELLCNDNATEQILDPFVEIANPVAGDYRIWVGSAKEGDMIPGALVMTTKADVDLGTFKLGELIQRPSIPQTDVEPTAAATLNPQVEALTGRMSKSAAALKPGAQQTIKVTAEGELPLFRLPAAQAKGCAGLVTGAPSHAFTWSGDAAALRIGFQGDGDSTLMVVATNSRQVWCNDDADTGGADPAIEIADPADDLYLVYVGRVSPEKPVTGQLTIVAAAKE